MSMPFFNPNSSLKYLRMFSALGLFGLICLGCTPTHFTVKETTAQRFVMNESARAIDITIYLSDIENDVNFDYLVYNRQKVTVRVDTTVENQTKLSALVQRGGKSIEGTNQTQVNEPNQLVYTKGSKQYQVKLDSINYLPNKVNPKQ